MTMNEPVVTSSLKEMYDSYYNSEVFAKRELTAIQTMEHIKQLWDGSVPEKVLDVGAGEGSLLYQLGINNFAKELYGVEISQSGIDAIKAKNIPLLMDISKFDGYKIPYPDKYFDIAISIHVLEHVEHERIFLAELERVAHHILIEIPLENTISIKRSIKISGKFGHINFYNPETFVNLLNTSGLKIVRKKVFYSVEQLELLCSNSFNLSKLKFYFRKYMLIFFPNLATNFMTYLMMTYCVSKDE